MIFISYRIDDSNDVVSRLATDLMEEFGDDAVFLDTLRLKGSQNWPEEIDRQVRDCQVMLVAIGRIWQEVRFESGKFKGFPRLHDEQDWVRREITLGLKQSKILIPVLINGALPPDEEWLETVGLKGLHSKQAMTLRTKDYPNDFQDLIAVMRKDCPLLPQGTEKKRLKSSDPADVALIPRPSSITYYLNRLTEETASLALLGMGRGLQIDLPISEAYVPLRTMLARSMGLRGTETFQSGRAEHEEDVELGSVFHKAAHLGLRAVILLGEPGSGKTTGARQMAWRLASGKNSPSELGLPAGMIPVLLRFRNLSRAALENKNDGLRLFLEEETRCALAPEGQQAPAKDLLSHNAGGLLWILDGLDEVIDPKARSTVAGWIRKGLKQRPSDWFLVTCRFQGYFRDGVPLGPQFVEFHVRPLDDGQVEQFVRDWFSAAFKKLLGPGPTSEARAADDSTRLLEILALPAYQTGRIRELRTNPLLLTILCIVFHEERKLPTGRAELYAHCIRVFLETWRRELYESAQGDKVEPYDARAAQDVLAQVAWWMHQQQDRTAAPLEDLAAEAATGLMDVADNSGLGRDGGRFLERMRDETGILALGGDGRCGFLHLSFQEYLAAEHAVGRGLAKELATRAPQSWWREVALLSLRSSQPYCEKFFVELLAAGIADDHPELADRCLNEARYVTLAPFLEALQQGGSTTRVAAVLRLLRDRVAQA
ncbi:MAG: NACHT domain-containing protein, partial [Planctomycetales bacterium]